MKKNQATVIILGLFLISLCSFRHPAAKRILVSDFGAIPNDGKNDLPQLKRAIEYCKSKPGSILFFAPGIYDIRDEKAVQLMNDAMSGKLGPNFWRVIFQPYYPHVKALDFAGTHDLTIEAAGATLLCDGWLEPLSLRYCKNLTVKGLTIDFKRKPYSQAKVVDVQPDWFDCEIDQHYPIDTSMTLLRIMFWDVEAHRLCPWDYSPVAYPGFKLVGQDRLRVFLKVDPAMKGNIMVTPHSFHFRPAILIQETENTKLEDVTIHSNPGMGIVGHRSSDILLKGVRIVPEAGGIQSTNTDATHFTSCKGLIRFENCQIGGQGDDCTNIHNYYYTIRKPDQGKGYELVVKDADIHAGVLDYPDIGDTLELVEKRTLLVAKKLVVRSRQNDTVKMCSRVRLNEDLPSGFENNYYLINVTRLPRVEIVGCSFSGNRARGILIKTRNVLIERCLIRETTGTGIHVGTEEAWHEGPASQNVVIRYNHIIRCGTGAGTIDGASGIAVTVSNKVDTIPGLHKNILIEGNIIEGDHGKNGIVISSASGVTIRYNEITGCETPVRLRYSDNVKVYANKGAADLNVKTVSQ